jgi:hypothetical protein
MSASSVSDRRVQAQVQKSAIRTSEGSTARRRLHRRPSEWYDERDIHEHAVVARSILGDATNAARALDITD